MNSDLPPAQETCDVAVIGGGTAGLSVATALRRLGLGSVVVLEREAEAGGIPRHCGHYPFGLREHARLMKGPDYARQNIKDALAEGVDLRTRASVMALGPGGVMDVVTNGTRTQLSARRVVICTGVRESSRAQRLISGDRPLGILTTGALQDMVYLKGQIPFRRPVILGSELVSFSAIQTCLGHGIKPVAVVEEEPRIIASRALTPYLWMHRLPCYTEVRDLSIHGSGRVEAVRFADRTGVERQLDCDGVILSGRFRPERGLLSLSHLRIDPGTGGPEVDQFSRCSDPVYFATGNLLRAAESSSYCWHEAKNLAAVVAEDLQSPIGTGLPEVTLSVNDPDLRFVVPQRLVLTKRPGAHAHLYFGLNRAINAEIIAQNGAQELSLGRVRARPVRRIRKPLAVLMRARPGETLHIQKKDSV